MIFKLEKNVQKKRKTHGKSKNKTSKLKKNRKQINGEKRNVKKGKKTGKKWICPFEAPKKKKKNKQIEKTK
jgi:hypothetical protein